MAHARYFDLEDGPTNKVLIYLDSLSRSQSGTDEQMHGWISGTIRAIGLLPAPVKRHFNPLHYSIGNAHFEADSQRRDSMWRELADDLAGELDAVLADPSLAKGAGADLKSRPATLGERLTAICEKLWEAVAQGGNADSLAAQLEREGAGTEVRYDAAQLRRLLARKRVPDWSRHRSDMFRLIGHARCVAENLHHRA